MAYATQAEVLSALTAGTITSAQALEALAALDHAKVVQGITVRANPLTGGISVYGLQRMPITLFPEQWERLFTVGGPKVRDFIATHKAHLPMTKGAAFTQAPPELIGEGKPFRIPAARDAAGNVVAPTAKAPAPPVAAVDLSGLGWTPKQVEDNQAAAKVLGQEWSAYVAAAKARLGK